MEQIPDHPVIRQIEKTGYPAQRWRRKDDGKGLHGDPARLSE